jgi:uncharacterized membrane protein
MPEAHSIRSRAELFRQPIDVPQQRTNVGLGERWASSMAGGGLVVYGLLKRNPLGLIAALAGGGLIQRGLSGHCQVYQALGLDTAHPKRPASVSAGSGIRIDESITILKPADELFQFWRNVENLPQVMPGLVSVTQTGFERSHWVAKGPLGNVEWDAETIAERPNELISWRSVEGSTVGNSGSVRFESAVGPGTTVRVELLYDPPAGRAGAALAWLAGVSPASQVREALENFKRTMESGSPPGPRENQPVGDDLTHSAFPG